MHHTLSPHHLPVSNWSLSRRDSHFVRNSHRSPSTSSSVAIGPRSPHTMASPASTSATTSSPAGPQLEDNMPYEAVPELQKLHSLGWPAYLGMALAGVVYNTGQMVKDAVALVFNPVAFFSRKDRSFMNQMDAIPGIQHEYLNVNGIRLHAVSLGRRPDKPLMLFCHGFPEFWYSWRHLLKHYSQHYDAVALDMRGYGLSDKPKGVNNYRLDLLAKDVAGAVRALGHERAVLVAQDWGAIVCWVTAGMYPGEVDRIITMAGPHLGLAAMNRTPEQSKKSWYIAMFQIPFCSELSFLRSDLKLLGEVFKPGSPWGPENPRVFTDEDREWYKWAFGQPGAATATLNWYRALGRHLTYAGIPEVWHAVKRRLPMPCMSIMGGADTALEPSVMNHLDKVAPVSESHVLEGVSHWVACDAPDRVIQLVDSFLAKHPPTPPRSKL